MGYSGRLEHRRSCRGIATQGEPPGVLPPRLPCVLLCLLRGASLELLEEQRLLAVNKGAAVEIRALTQERHFFGVGH